MKRLWLVWLATFTSVVVACGGNVNLGEHGPSDPALHPEGGAPGEPLPTVGQLAAQLTPDNEFDMLAVAGDYLYLGTFSGVSRCKKASCIPTLQPLSQVRPGVSSLQVDEDTLGVRHLDQEKGWLSAYALPGNGEEQVIIDDLPRVPYRGFDPLWHGRFVYWHMEIDGSVYRCAVPSCEDGPLAVGRYEGNFQGLRAESELIFYHDKSLIYRYDSGTPTAVPLLADELLSDAPIKPATAAAPSSIVSIATAGGVLYASIATPAEFHGCVEDCPHEIVRWPVNGGARQTVVASPTRIGTVFAFGEEVAWTETSSIDGFDYGAVLYSCLASDCDATRRTLGRVVNPGATVVADDTDLYWFEAHRDQQHPSGVTGLVNHQIRRAARLSPPDER